MGCMASTTIAIEQPAPTVQFKRYTPTTINTSTPTYKKAQTIQEYDYVKTYPNPATSTLMVNLGHSITGRGTMTIVGMNGVVMSTINFDKTSPTYSTSVDVSMLAPGTYILKIEFENEKPMMSKFIKL
jgi:hypothetical protein